MGHGDVDERLAGLGEGLEVRGEAAVPAEDGEGAHDDPAEGLGDEAALPFGDGDAVQGDPRQEVGHPVGQLLAAVAAVGEDAPQPGALGQDGAQRVLGAVAVGDARRVDPHADHRTHQVHDQVPLAPADQHAAVEAALAARLGGLHALGVDDHHARRRLPPGNAPDPLPQRRQDVLPGAVAPPLGELVADGLPRGVLSGEHAPLAAGAQEIEDRVDDQAQADPLAPARSLWHRQQRRDQRPLGVGEVGLVAPACRAGRGRAVHGLTLSLSEASLSRGVYRLSHQRGYTAIFNQTPSKMQPAHQ